MIYKLQTGNRMEILCEDIVCFSETDCQLYLSFWPKEWGI